jgi:hypothetical protein
MRRIPSLIALLLIPVLAVLLSAPGCGKAKKPARGGGELEQEDTSSKSNEPAKTEISSTGFGSLEGLVTYDGDPPQWPSLKPEMEKHNDKAQCLMGKPDEILDQTWIVGGMHNGVANVCIFLKAPGNQYFKIADQDKKVTTTVELRQPHCAFQPHVVDLYPEYYDGKEYQKTGQTFKIINDAKVAHNTKMVGDPTRNEPINPTLPPGGSTAPMVLNPQAKELNINCSFHTWMSAYAWVFDHPYHAVTRGEGEKDKAEDFGKFKIDRVPAGVEVTVIAWHPGAGNAGYVWGREGKKMTFKTGENNLDFKIKKQ